MRTKLMGCAPTTINLPTCIRHPSLCCFESDNHEIH